MSVVFAVVFGVLAAMYFLPTAVALARGSAVIPVAALNILLGWSVVGWIAALLLALATRSGNDPRGATPQLPPGYPALGRVFAPNGLYGVPPGCHDPHVMRGYPRWDGMPAGYRDPGPADPSGLPYGHTYGRFPYGGPHDDADFGRGEGGGRPAG